MVNVNNEKVLLGIQALEKQQIHGQLPGVSCLEIPFYTLKGWPTRL
jgi:hypothetical protein